MTERTIDFAVDEQKPTIVVAKRTFDAPQTLVFAALTRPELLERWDRGFLINDGMLGLQPPSATLQGRAAYTETLVPERLAYALTFPARRGDPGSGAAYLLDSETGERHPRPSRGFDRPAPPDHVAQVTEVLVEKGGETTLTITILFASKAERVCFMEGPTCAGIAFSMSVLDRLLASLLPSAPTA